MEILDKIEKKLVNMLESNNVNINQKIGIINQLHINYRIKNKLPESISFKDYGTGSHYNFMGTK